ncbi:hypothetical protein [Acidovorax sp.]|uniref:hypothetical protein n=1 Tax=Acidovorax sp. TaxID=1872122 RepID=UPI003BB19FDD
MAIEKTASPHSRSALTINLLVHAAATAANVAPVIVAPRQLAELKQPPVTIGIFVAIVYFDAMLARVTLPERYALVFSIRQTGVPLRGALAALLMPWMAQSTGLRWGLLEMALLCILAGGLFFTYLSVVVGPPLFGVVGAWSGTLSTSVALFVVPLAAVGWMLVHPHLDHTKGIA